MHNEWLIELKRTSPEGTEAVGSYQISTECLVPKVASLLGVSEADAEDMLYHATKKAINRSWWTGLFGSIFGQVVVITAAILALFF